MSIAWENVGDAEDHSPGLIRKGQQSSKSNLQVSRLFSQSKLSDFVILQAGGESFYFPTSILVKKSGKLGRMTIQASLRSKIANPTTPTLDFPDVDPVILGTYLHLAYCFETNVLNDDIELMDNPNDLKFLVQLYQFTAYFHDHKLADWLHVKIKSVAPNLDHGAILERESKLKWMQIYRDAFEALHMDFQRQFDLAWHISYNFCKFIPLGNIGRDISLLDDSPDFLRALFLRLTEGHFPLHKPVPSLESGAASIDHEKQTGDDWDVEQESAGADMWPAACYESVGTDKAASGQASSSATVYYKNDDWGTGIATPSSSTSSEYNEFSWLPVRSAKKISNDGWGPPPTENQDTPKKISNGGWDTTATEEENSTWKPSGSGHASGATWGASGSGYATDSW